MSAAPLRWALSGGAAAPLACALVLLAAASDVPAQTATERLIEAFSAVVSVRAQAPPDARTAGSLGTAREGSGVVIDGNGLVLTIGYLILEAARVDLAVASAETVPAEVVAYDHATGFGLVRALEPLEVNPMRLGVSAELVEGTPVLAAAPGGPTAVRPAIVVSRRELAGYWEYLLEDAIFTAPPHPQFAGAALIGPEGTLLGIGSLLVGDARPGAEVRGNMFVPIDALKPILGELLVAGRGPGPPRPWLGVYTEEVGGRLVVRRVADEGPAAAAGIERGDVIAALADEPIASQADFYRRLWARGEAGVEVPLTVQRGEQSLELTVVSGDRYQWLRLTPGF